jgi:threonine/homoserine/homoserine lactone efflux protein
MLATLATFVPSPPVLAAFVAASVVLGITPGPDMTFYLSKTVAQSRPAGFAALAGAAAGLLVHSLLAAAGLSVLLAASVTAFTLLKIAGAVFLAWLAVDAIRHGSSLALTPGGRRQRLPAIFVKGVLINLLNPKIIIFFVTFLPQFVSAGDPHVARKLLFLGVTFIVANLPVCSGLILAAGSIAHVLKRSPRLMRLVDWLFAGVLGAFAARLILTQAK